MTPLSRYDPNASTETGMIAHSSGDWVPFDEALARTAELEDANTSLQNGYDLAISRAAELAAAIKELLDAEAWYESSLDSRDPDGCDQAAVAIQTAVNRLAQLKE